jgi:cytochrome oxidase Cu insertion factor (SCO1/SenC/PrrC family)
MVRWLIATTATFLLLGGMALGVWAIGLSRDTRAGSSADSRSALASATNTAAESAADDSGWMKEYTLTERSGAQFQSRELAGQVHVVNFFFTTCPTTCRVQTAAVQSLAKEFGPQGVKFLSITCDPENDTPAALAVYARQFDAHPEHWLFLTGELPYVRRVGAEVYFLPVDRGTHSESLLVLDRGSKIRGRFSWKDAQSVADMKRTLAELLAEPTPDPTPGG